MNFEYDPIKSKLNAAKHGIDFEAAQALWLDVTRVIIPARTEDEIRYLMIATMDGKFWSAIFTSRSGMIRIISVRRSRQEEIRLYEST